MLTKKSTIQTMTHPTLLISCEHAVNNIPANYQHLFNDPSILNTHQAYDKGAIEIATKFSQVFDCPLIQATASRLLIDCNRSLTNPNCFSAFTKSLSKAEKQLIIEKYYHPYRQALESWIANTVEQGQTILHLSIHSFTPVLNNITRNADIGFLYDPGRHGEKQLAQHWKKQLTATNASYQIRMNYPYRGISDGFVSALRKKYSSQHYLGIEIESNQQLMITTQASEKLAHSLIESFKPIRNMEIELAAKRTD